MILFIMLQLNNTLEDYTLIKLSEMPKVKLKSKHAYGDKIPITKENLAVSLN